VLVKTEEVIFFCVKRRHKYNGRRVIVPDLLACLLNLIIRQYKIIPGQVMCIVSFVHRCPFFFLRLFPVFRIVVFVL